MDVRHRLILQLFVAVADGKFLTVAYFVAFSVRADYFH
jgi:hypothetical protein